MAHAVVRLDGNSVGYQQVDVGVCPYLAPGFAAIEAHVNGHGQRVQCLADGLCDVCPVHVETVLWVQSYETFCI